jgi:hypothetical protein
MDVPATPAVAAEVFVKLRAQLPAKSLPAPAQASGRPAGRSPLIVASAGGGVEAGSVESAVQAELHSFERWHGQAGRGADRIGAGANLGQPSWRQPGPQRGVVLQLPGGTENRRLGRVRIYSPPMRDIETIDSELRLVALLRRAARERGGPLPSIDVAGCAAG